MAKKVVSVVKLQIPAEKQHRSTSRSCSWSYRDKYNEFCKEFNEKTAPRRVNNTC